ncbi:MAG: hypothetical protein CVU12_05935 [Bacteroidetes bacterium HGW-Bacteroidetes-7]|jgi:hypothetical protein|nr:MAG: hypothetical protein CVU12_05935 [Bacteroidetes bacterium HGW-Bacteroidetes-7]
MKRILLTSILVILPLSLLLSQTSEKSPLLLESGKTTAKIGGTIRAVAFQDFSGTIMNYEFINSTMSAPNNWDLMSRNSIDASASRFSIKITQKTEKLGNIDMYLESDFRGANETFRIRHAYVSFKGFIFGQTWSFMTDIPANAPTIDIQNVNSRTFFRTPLIGYVGNLGKGWTMGVALELPKIKITTATGFKAINQRVPDLPVYIQYKGTKGHIKLTGAVRSLQYGVTSSSDIETETGLGVQLSGTFKPAKGLTLYSQGIYGKGIARYINDLAAQNMDLLPVAVNALSTMPMYGISLGAKLDFSKSVYASSTFSLAGLEKNDGLYITKDNDFFKGSYFSASLFWNAYKNLTMAWEYIHGTRINTNDVKGNANRAQFMVLYSF